LLQEKISLLVNATHPYAAQISKNALAAATELQIPFLRMTRPSWVKLPEDHWIEVPDMEAAANYLIDYKTISQNKLYKHIVFLTIGNRGLSIFRKCNKNRIIVRTVDPPEEAYSWSEAIFLEGRGPFTLENELALLRQNAITILITRNSGGGSTYAKIEAARELRIPVVMVARPVTSSSEICQSLDDTTNWISKKIML
jgi:precorrin-6A/cobalt-precorrin-6A reductase